MKLTKILICLLIFWTGTLSASPYFSFKKYQVEDGLSHNTVWCALQDSYGFIWLGTSDGLNRYDGRGNKVYRNVLNDKFSLENNFVEALIEVDKNIWVGTNSGLYIYDRDTDRFSCFDKTTQYNVYISSEIKKIIKTENGLIWIATLGQGFFIYDPKTEVLTQNSVQTSFVWDLCQSADRKRVYISSLQEGLLCFDENGKFLRTYEISLDINASDSYKVNCIQNIDGDIWIGAGNNLLSRLDERTDAMDNYSGSAFNFGAVHCLLKYTDKELLVGTDNGLYLFNQNTNTFQRTDNPTDPRSLSDQTINGMMWDAEGALWVLTNLGESTICPSRPNILIIIRLPIWPECPERERLLLLSVRIKMGISGLELKAVYISSMLLPANFLLIQSEDMIIKSMTFVPYCWMETIYGSVLMRKGYGLSICVPEL